MTVDFHFHSTASDGTLSPAALARRVRGFAAAALTDHDNCEGTAEFAGVADDVGADGCLKVSGIELSVAPGAGFDRFHLLGLGIDPENVQLKALLEAVLEGRKARNERIIANFRRLGIEMAEPSGQSRDCGSPEVRRPSGPRTIHSYSHGGVLARPHFARWLVDCGHAPDAASAFAKYLLPDSPKETRCYEERWHPDQETAFRAVHAAGGVAVMAHPKYWRRAWKGTGPDFALAGRELAAAKERGLDGIEALYQANSGEENVEFTRLAGKIGLLKSAGSDFHGANKPTVPLGMEVSETFIAPLLERLSGSPEFRAVVKASKFAKWGKSADRKPQPWGELEEGRILLQDHNDRVSFRNLKIKVFENQKGVPK